MSEINNGLLHQHIRIRMSHDIISSVSAVQGDTAREFYFVFDDYEIPADAELRVYVQKPSGKEIYHYCYLANGDVVVQPTMQMLAEVGKNIGQIQVIRNHAIVTTYPFYLLVEPNIIYTIKITSMDEFLILTDLIDSARIEIKALQDLSKTVKAQEDSRVAAENERVQAENKRKTDTANAIKNCNDATDRATRIADSLESSISGVINDTTTSTTTTYSSKKLEDKFKDLKSNIDNIISDSVSTTTTYSSKKIESKIRSLINDTSSSTTTTFSSNKIENLMSTIIRVSPTEPTNQILNGFWFVEE